MKRPQSPGGPSKRGRFTLPRYLAALSIYIKDSSPDRSFSYDEFRKYGEAAGVEDLEQEAESLRRQGVLHRNGNGLALDEDYRDGLNELSRAIEGEHQGDLEEFV
ncbi:MAG: hypothetical protein ABEJ07_00130 [Candidatus Nanohaloarchaea archaeon]